MLVVSGDGVPLAVPVLRSLTPLSAAAFSRLTDYQPSANYCSSHADFAMTSFQLQVPSAAMGGVVTIGNFDGVHRGHQAMLSVVREHAVKKDCPAVVVTFDPHPITILKPDVHLPRLSTIPVRSQLLKQHGADEVIVLPVCKQLLNMTPEQFFQDVVAQLQPVGMVEGPDFRFGRDRAGDTTVLQTFCDSADIDLKVISAVCFSDRMISSTQIRGLLSAGEVTAAVELLGHSYSMAGFVRHGAGRGGGLGFPTANLEDINTLLPADGVYGAECVIDQQRYAVAVSIGPNPTFADNSRKVECHIIGFSGDLYERELRIDLLRHIRGLISFPNLDTLKQQIRRDIADSVAAFEALQ